MERIINIENKKIALNLSNVVYRFDKNPILTCHDVNKVWTTPHLKVITVHNAGITIFNDEVLMLFRSHLRNGMSILGIARSKDGLTNWKVDDQPAMLPCDLNNSFAKHANKQEIIENESGGLEDARIAKIGNDYIITYSAYHNKIQNRVRVSIAITQDFKTFKRYGSVLETDMRNVVIFPEKVNNKYYALFRPNDATDDHTGGVFKQICLGISDDYHLNNWEVNTEKPIMKQDGMPSAFADKIGPGATPIKTKHGWLNIFHGVRGTMDGNPYCLGVALHDLEDVSKVKVSNIPILMPSKADCKVAETDYVHVPNVVFSCGAIRKENGEIYIYYAGNDTVMNVAITHEDILAELCNNYPQDPLTGIAQYNIKDSLKGTF
ncbi:hypothetical protein [Lutibacter sp.]|uniref:glycoside hydrolase family 130 protein n=1 Tax=Lutibacter sp. TaxID=1925666 RepID=UPI0025BFFFF8|nr:hypothetical protein [Lutibacter sp.]MCF6181921.1 hypothetical protein [Lutibacter sp.]